VTAWRATIFSRVGSVSTRIRLTLLGTAIVRSTACTDWRGCTVLCIRLAWLHCLSVFIRPAPTRNRQRITNSCRIPGGKACFVLALAISQAATDLRAVLHLISRILSGAVVVTDPPALQQRDRSDLE